MKRLVDCVIYDPERVFLSLLSLQMMIIKRKNKKINQGWKIISHKSHVNIKNCDQLSDWEWKEKRGQQDSLFLSSNFFFLWGMMTMICH